MRCVDHVTAHRTVKLLMEALVVKADSNIQQHNLSQCIIYTMKKDGRKINPMLSAGVRCLLLLCRKKTVRDSSVVTLPLSWPA